MSESEASTNTASNELTHQDLQSLRTVFLGSALIFVILTVFVIVTLNAIKEEMKGIRQDLGILTQMTSQNNPGQYEVVTPGEELGEEGEVVYRLRMVPQEVYPEDMIDPETGMPIEDDGLMDPEGETDMGETEGDMDETE